MESFKIYKSSEQHPAQEMLKGVENQVGFVPNIFAVLAESPVALAAFTELNNSFAHSSFNESEREVVQLAASVINECDYCVAGHTAFASQLGVEKGVTDSIRNHQAVADPKLEALRNFTQSVVRERGLISPDDLVAFYKAGYTPRNVMDVILGIAIKSISNSISNIAGLPLDEQFAEFAWSSSSDNQAA